MKEKRNCVLRYVAASLFVLSAVALFIGRGHWTVGYMDLLRSVGLLILGICCCFKEKRIICIGCIGLVIGTLLKHQMYGRSIYLLYGFGLAPWILLGMISLLHKPPEALKYVAIGTIILNFVGIIVTYPYIFMWIFPFLTQVIYIIAYSCEVLYLMPQNRKQNITIAGASTQPSSMERLSQLKKLLDDGIITQEEFEAKKRVFFEHK